jgi:hypothetical protein
MDVLAGVEGGPRGPNGFGNAAKQLLKMIGAAAVLSALVVGAGNNLKGYPKRANHLLSFPNHPSSFHFRYASVILA